MLLARESDGGQREVDDGTVAVLVGRQREEGVRQRLRQLRPLPQALLPQLLPEFCRPNQTPPHSVRKTNSNAAAEKGTHEAHYLEAAAMWCDGSYAMRLPRSTS